MIVKELKDFDTRELKETPSFEESVEQAFKKSGLPYDTVRSFVESMNVRFKKYNEPEKMYDALTDISSRFRYFERIGSLTILDDKYTLVILRSKNGDIRAISIIDSHSKSWDSVVNEVYPYKKLQGWRLSLDYHSDQTLSKIIFNKESIPRPVDYTDFGAISFVIGTLKLMQKDGKGMRFALVYDAKLKRVFGDDIRYTNNYGGKWEVYNNFSIDPYYHLPNEDVVITNTGENYVETAFRTYCALYRLRVISANDDSIMVQRLTEDGEIQAEVLLFDKELNELIITRNMLRRNNLPGLKID